MSIYVDEDTKLVVQGITGSEGGFHAERMEEYGTEVVAGVTPGRGGESISGIPVYDSVAHAVDNHEINTSVIFVPPAFAADAILESFDSGVDLTVAITEGIPTHDMIKVYRRMEETGADLIGPNCPGVITPGESKVGIMPGHIFNGGSVGLVSRSGTLTYQLVDSLGARDIGQSTVVGIGGDPIIGSDFIDVLDRFEEDSDTDIVVLVGEIGGTAEENAAEWIDENMSTDVVAYIGGRTAPPGKRMGHAGAIVSGGGTGTAESKINALEGIDVPVADTPDEVSDLVMELL